MNPFNFKIMDKFVENDDWSKKWTESFEAISQNPACFSSLSDDLRDDMHLAYLAISLNPDNLKYAGDASPSVFSLLSDRLRSDEFYARKAVSKDGSLLEFIGENLKDNKDIALLACQHSNNKNGFKFLPDSLKTLKEIYTIAIKSEATNYQYLHEAIRENKRSYKRIKI